jgi:hypothetical protein
MKGTQAMNNQSTSTGKGQDKYITPAQLKVALERHNQELTEALKREIAETAKQAKAKRDKDVERMRQQVLMRSLRNLYRR